MKHEDFTRLEVEETLDIVLEFCLKEATCRAVHWLSTYGLSRVAECTNETWHWTFSTVDVLGKHVISKPGTDIWDLIHVWRKVAPFYPANGKNSFVAHRISTTPSDYLAMPLVFDGTLQGVLLFEDIGACDVTALSAKLQVPLQMAAKYVAFAYKHLEARNLSYEDELTGLYNQRYLPMVLEHEIDRSRRDHAQFSLLFLDVDYFKMVNDGRGHWVGSKLLVELGKILKAQVRSCDYAFRYGGDEFIILLSASNAENSKKVAERVRKVVEDHTFQIDGADLKLTVSIGLASYPEHAQSASGLIQIADQAMYYGKRKSRNIVFVAS